MADAVTLANILDLITYTIAIASVIVKLTPTPEDDAALSAFLRVLRAIALNKNTPD